MRNDSTGRPDPVLLAQVGDLAQMTVELLDRATRQAMLAGLVVDAEIFDAQKTLTSWASWLASKAEQAGGDQT